MKKIMFNDKYDLTQAVLEGRKTQTRRTWRQKDADKAYAKSYNVFSKIEDLRRAVKWGCSRLEKGM